MGTSTETFKTYSKQINQLLKTFQDTQALAIESAADKIVQAYQSKKRFLVFGSGHSHMIAEELYARAGGLAFVTPIIPNELNLSDHPSKSTMLERIQAMAKVYFDLYHLEAGDVILIASNSGRNALPVELAKIAKDAGLTVIAFINAQQAKTTTSRHSLGKNLDAYAKIIIDNCGAFGDAGFDIGNGIMMGSSSTIIGAFMAEALSIQVATKIKDLGLEIPVFRSSNLDGADAYNHDLMNRFCKNY